MSQHTDERLKPGHPHAGPNGSIEQPSDGEDQDGEEGGDAPTTEGSIEQPSDEGGDEDEGGEG